MFPAIALGAALACAPAAHHDACPAAERIAALEARVAALESRPLVTAGPALAFDSGWIALEKGEEMIVTHAVGGDLERYIVLFDSRSDTHGQHHIGYGGRAVDGFSSGYTGCYYYQLDTSTVTLRRATDDTFCHELKVRIVTY